MESYKVLVVEDEIDILELIKIHFTRERYTVHTAMSGTEARELLKTNKYDLLVIDWMIPGISGVEVVREMRARGETSPSVLMITAKGGSSDIVFGLEAGADDYLTKPFDLSVLMARSRALLRRWAPKEDQLSFGPLSINLAAYEARMGDEVIPLTPYEFKFLTVLAKNRGKVLTRAQLIQSVQGDVALVDRVVDTHVFGLRKKLGTSGDLIETVRGVGYRIAPDETARR